MILAIYCDIILFDMESKPNFCLNPKLKLMDQARSSPVAEQVSKYLSGPKHLSAHKAARPSILW